MQDQLLYLNVFVVVDLPVRYSQLFLDSGQSAAALVAEAGFSGHFVVLEDAAALCFLDVFEGAGGIGGDVEPRPPFHS